MSTTMTQQFPVQKIIVFLSLLLHVCSADVGTGARYSPPYLPTACYGTEAKELLSSSLFGSAGEGIWDDGLACGRQYLVRCISAVVHKTCVPGQTIYIKIVDRASSSASKPSRDGVTMVLSDTAFSAIANQTADYINIEFQEV